MSADVHAVIDASHRIVRLECRREFDVQPIVIELPFVMWKDISAGVIAAEVIAEQALAKRDRNGGRRLILSQGG